MNIHPLFVHFPIALLSLYSLLEFIRFKSITRLPYWFYLKAFLVIAGFLFSLIAALTGLLAAGFFSGAALSGIVRYHAFFAFSTILVYGSIASSYAKSWRDKTSATHESIIILGLAFIGFILISFTGAIGAIMVYGKDNDIFTSLIYRLITGEHSP